MKCYPCGFDGEKKDFGTIEAWASGEVVAFLLGRMPPPAGHVGNVEILVCPNCGALHSTMRGTIAAKGERT